MKISIFPLPAHFEQWLKIFHLPNAAHTQRKSTLSLSDFHTLSGFGEILLAPALGEFFAFHFAYFVRSSIVFRETMCN